MRFAGNSGKPPMNSAARRAIPGVKNRAVFVRYAQGQMLKFYVGFFLTLAVYAADTAPDSNELTAAEKSQGWRLLFDGRSMAEWKDPRKKTPPGDAWTIEDGCLKANPKPRITEDLVSGRKYGDFELTWDWKIAPAGNSGVKYRIQDFVFLTKATEKPGSKRFEDHLNYAMENRLATRAKLGPDEKAQDYVVGFEYQMIDDAKNADALRGTTHTTGALYDMVAPSSHPAKPVGEFNHSRLLVRGNHVEPWLNDVKVVDATLDSEDVKKGLAARWGTTSGVYKLLTEQPHKPCPISLQNHGAEAWFRNIKIRALPH